MSPTADALASRLAGLSPAQRALLEQRLLERGRRADQSIQPVRVEEPLPLSFAQRRFWFVDQLDADGCVNNVARAIQLTGPLRVAALHSALNGLIARHAALRTTFPLVSGQPVQQVHAEASIDLPIEDVSHDALAGRLKRLAQRPFELRRELPIRATLLRLGPDEHVLLLTVHHIASDGWSAEIIDRELSALYASSIGEGRGLLAPLPIQYPDFSRWQQEAVSSGRLDHQLAYWQGQLDGAPAYLRLPLDHPRPSTQSFRGARVAIDVPAVLEQRIRALAQGAHTTPFVVLLGAFQALLGRYARQSDVVVGSPVAGRNQPETAGLIGCFINSLPLRADLSDDPTFRDLVERVRSTVLGGLANQELPFDKLVEELRPTREPAYSPIFQTMFAFRDGARLGLSLPGVEVRELSVELEVARLDLTVVLEQRHGGWRCVAEYNTDLFDPATVTALLENYRVFLGYTTANPLARISEVPLTLPRRPALSIEVNTHARTGALPSTVPEAFSTCARRAPEAIAVTAGGRSLTYAELDHRSDDLAHRLRQRGVGPSVPVGVLVERSAETVVALLGILKAGGAYLPLDGAYPDERLRFMLSDAAAQVVLAGNDQLERARQLEVEVLSIDGPRPDFSAVAADPCAAAIGPQTPAYIMYTSGSTGQPKGVVVPHAAIVGLVLDTDYVHLGPLDRVAFASSLAFDAATFEIWGALLNGARLVGIDRTTLLSPTVMAETLRTHGITTLFLTTALFNRYAHLVPNAFSSLESVLFGGEAVDAHSVRRVLRHGPPKRLLHVYGPTEATTFATWFEVTHVDQHDTTVPIGRPLRRGLALVLDEHRQPVPRGEAGELYLGGSRLALGYLGAPELTTERFVADPFSGADGARLYRTGDVVRMHEDGNLVFVGRRDQQVKIRGFRVEPGEVEHALLRHPNVREAVVVARADAAGTNRLVAYLSPRQAPVPDAASLRAHLAGSLPDYMLPSEFIGLSSLPLGPGGKIDRNALPPPSSLANPTAADVPRTQLEAAIERIWAEVLGRERVGIRDNFFDLGGHSLLAAQLFVRLEQELQVRLPLSSLFPNATIEAQAGLLASRQPPGAPGESSLVTLQGQGEGSPFAWVHAIDGDVLRFEPLARALGTRRPFVAFRAHGLLDGTEPLDDIQAIANRYACELRAAYPGPYLLGGFSSGATIAFELARQLVEQGQEVALLVILDGAAPTSGRRSWRQLWSSLSYLPVDLYHYVAHALEPGQRLQLARFKARSVRAQVERWMAPSDAPVRAAPAEVLEAVADFSPRHYRVALAHHAAMLRYVPGELQGNVLVLRSRVRRLTGLQDRSLGWAGLVRGHLEVRSLPGQHEELLKPPFVHAVARTLEAAVQRTRCCDLIS